MLILGEVHTGLLQNSTALPAPQCEGALGLFRGETVRRSERPIAHAVSPDLLAGVDCRLATGSGARVRGVGTVVHRATITGGHVLQGSAMVRLTGSEARHRLPWSHYLARPGRVETIGGSDWADLARGFVAAPGAAATLDLGAISSRVMHAVQSSPFVDRTPPFRTARTRLQWVAVTTGGAAPTGSPGDSGERVAFSIESEQRRTLQLHCPAEQVAALAAFCEDLALHDWLLTTLLNMIERSRIGGDSRARTVGRLRPAIDHLLHLWMPAARAGQDLLELWEGLERRPGFSRQWQASVNRIRDQIAASTIALLDSRS
jgi:hypothetical protein